MARQPADNSIFDSFSTIRTTFKTVSSHAISAAILIPKTLQPGSHPLILNLHGGYLITGEATFAPWFPQWILTLALQNSAIIISGNYRLLPTTNGAADVNEDIDDFWTWTQEKLSSVLTTEAPGHEVDLTQILLAGGSAGGYGCTQVALSHPKEVKALAIAYPMLDLDSPFWHQGPKQGTVMGFPLEMLGTKASTQKAIEEARETVTTEANFTRTLSASAVVQWGLFSSLFDPKQEKKREWLPLERIRCGETLPAKVWIFHGGADSGVPIEGSHLFVDEVKERLPSTDVRFEVVEGQEHGFDGYWEEWDSWSKAGLEWILEAWRA